MQFPVDFSGYITQTEIDIRAFRQTENEFINIAVYDS